MHKCSQAIRRFFFLYITGTTFQLQKQLNSHEMKLDKFTKETAF